MSIEQWSDLMFPGVGGKDVHVYGTVRAINADGSYEVGLNASNTTTRCAPCCTAAVGDRVLVCVKANGKCDAIGRLGGDLGGGADDFTETDPTVPAWAKQPTKPKYTASEVGADAEGSAKSALADAKAYADKQIAAIPTPDVSGQIGAHNVATDSHNDIRLLVQGLTDRLNALANSDDATLDQMSEIVAYIKANRGLIESVTTTKVNVSDIIDNLTTNVSNKPLSAAQGVALKALIDAIKVPTVDSALSSSSTNPVQNKVVKSALDGKAATSHTHSASDIAKAGYLAIHPELDITTTIPFINNDLAFLTLKGGSITAYTTTSADLTAVTLEQGELNLSGADKLFNGTPSSAYLMTDGDYTAVIDIALHKTLTYNNNFYIDFGLPGFRAKNIAVYVMNKDTETAYTLKNSVTNNAASYFFYVIKHSSTDSSGKTVQGFNRLRIVLSKFNQSGSSYGRRIAEIGLVNYSSGGLSETFISRGGCDGVYGSLVPFTNGSYDLGSSAKRWKSIYGTTLYQNGKQVANKEDIPTVSVVAGKINASEDLNTVIKSGMYRLEGLPANCPSGAIYGQLLVVRGGGDTISQIAFSYSNCNVWVRSGNSPDVGGNGAWKEWVQCYTTNYKPTADDVGALPLSGGTMAGNIVLPYGKVLKMKTANGTEADVLSSASSIGNLILGCTAFNALVLYNSVIPATAVSKNVDLGSKTVFWRNLYLSGGLSDGTNSVAIADIAKKSECVTQTWVENYVNETILNGSW